MLYVGGAEAEQVRAMPLKPYVLKLIPKTLTRPGSRAFCCFHR